MCLYMCISLLLGSAELVGLYALESYRGINCSSGGGVVVVAMDQYQQGRKSQQLSSNDLGVIDNFRTLEVTPAPSLEKSQQQGMQSTGYTASH